MNRILTAARRITSRADTWVRAGRLRKRARRSTIIITILVVAELVLATVLGRLGVVDQLLSPSGQGAQLLAGLAAAALLTLRLGLVFIAPPVLVYQWVRAALVPGEAQPVQANTTRRFGRRSRPGSGPRSGPPRYPENPDPRAIMEIETNP